MRPTIAPQIVILLMHTYPLLPIHMGSRIKASVRPYSQTTKDDKLLRAEGLTDLQPQVEAVWDGNPVKLSTQYQIRVVTHCWRSVRQLSGISVAIASHKMVAEHVPRVGPNPWIVDKPTIQCHPMQASADALQDFHVHGFRANRSKWCLTTSDAGWRNCLPKGLPEKPHNKKLRWDLLVEAFFLKLLNSFVAPV